jgi:hypothetical protein
MFARTPALDWLRPGLALVAVVAMAGCVRPAAPAPFQIAPPEAMAGTQSAWPVPTAPTAPRVAVRAGEVRLPAAMGLPLVLTFQGEVPAAFVQATREAIATWNAGLGEDVVVIGPAARGQQVHVAVDAQVTGEGPELVLGAARRSVPGDVWRIDLSPKTPAALLKGTIVHEIGHMFGLDHNGSTASVMYQRATGVSRPSADDLVQARRGVEAYKLELDTMLSGWRTRLP